MEGFCRISAQDLWIGSLGKICEGPARLCIVTGSLRKLRRWDLGRSLGIRAGSVRPSTSSLLEIRREHLLRDRLQENLCRSCAFDVCQARLVTLRFKIPSAFILLLRICTAPWQERSNAFKVRRRCANPPLCHFRILTAPGWERTRRTPVRPGRSARACAVEIKIEDSGQNFRAPCAVKMSYLWHNDPGTMLYS